ncbi:MAG: coenzyme F420-0:L-glutamate ligase [Patescibacteria group bacterium]|nr:coenzyme F420-0:L-glutamate ligase [Patescibacteria group bacterium]
MLQPNPGKNLEIEVRGKVFWRYPIKTKIITKDDKLEDVIKEYVMPHYEKGDIVAMSERMVAVTQGRLIHESEIKASGLAKFLVKFVKKWPNDPGFRNAKKMQVAINMIGVPRMLLAAFVSAITKPFGIRGLFYRICGHGVSEIDGFAPGTIPPYDQYAVLGPENPRGVCNNLAKKFGVEAVIVDANNIDVAILGTSDNLSIMPAEFRLAFLDNPIGQGLEQTPICIVRRKIV